MPVLHSSTRRLLLIGLVLMVPVLVFVGGVSGIGLYAQTQFVKQELYWRSDSAFQEWRGEIYFSQQRIDPLTGPGGPQEIVAIDRQSGALRPTGQSLESPSVSFAALSDRLLCFGMTEVLEFTTSGCRRIVPQPVLVAPVVPFVVQNRIHAVGTGLDGHPALFEFVDDRWVPRQRVALLQGGRTWAFDEARQEWRLVPRSALTASAGGFELVYVLPIGNQWHVISKFFSGGSSVVAYRTGLDVIDESVPSALAPVNAIADTTGWTRVDQLLQRGEIAPCDFQGQFFLATAKAPTLWRWDEQRRLFVPAGDFDVRFAGTTVAPVGLESPGTGFVAVNRYQTLQFSFPDGKSYVRASWKIPGVAETLVAFQGRLLLMLLALLGIVHLLSLAGCSVLSANRGESVFRIGLSPVCLAPLPRRGLARAFDLTLVLTPVVLLGVNRMPSSSEDFLDRQNLILESILAPGGWNVRKVQSLIPHFESLLIVLFPAFCVGLLALGACQAKFGVTPGKWCCGLRTIRTTRQPCDCLRSIVRELLLTVDTVLLLTPLPAIVSILFSHCRQRLGDRVCDTLVVEAAGDFAYAPSSCYGVLRTAVSESE